MIAKLHYLDGRVEERKCFGQTPPPVIVYPKGVIFVATRGNRMRQLEPDERITMLMPRQPE